MKAKRERTTEKQRKVRQDIVHHMLAADLRGESYVLPSWWTGPRPDPLSQTSKAENRQERQDAFRRTGDVP